VKVPLVDEVREARALLEKNRQASLDLEQVMVALARAQVGQREPDYERWYARLAERWKLTSPAQPAVPALMNARAAMSAASAGMSRASHRLEDLRHQQRHALSVPEHAELLAELDALQQRMGEIGMARILPIHRATLLSAVAGLVSDALAVVEAERAQGTVRPVRPVRSWGRLRALRETLPPVRAVLQLEPGEGRADDEQLVLPDGPASPEPPAALDWPQLEAFEQQFRTLEARMRELAQRWAGRVAELQAEYDRVSSRLYDRFG
jgi:hypothetical protein